MLLDTLEAGAVRGKIRAASIPRNNIAGADTAGTRCAPSGPTSWLVRGSASGIRARLFLSRDQL